MMKLHGLSPADYAAMSNSDLDTAYADAFYEGDSPTYTAAGDQIIQRLATPSAALLATFGYQQFPKFNAIQASGKTTAGFVSTDVAQQAVVTSAGNLATKAEGLMSSTGLLLMGIVGAVLLYKFGRK